MLLELLVEGSSGDHYEVTFSREGNVFRTFCTCQAGQNGTYCKHRVALMEGDLKNLLGERRGDLTERIASMMQGTEVEQAHQRFKAVQAAHVVAQDDLARAKKAFSKAMHK